MHSHAEFIEMKRMSVNNSFADSLSYIQMRCDSRIRLVVIYFCRRTIKGGVKAVVINRALYK